jgi:hypothetical protein
MYMHPTITAALAEQRRCDLIAHAERYRLVRTARGNRVTLERTVPGLGKIMLLMTAGARRTAMRLLPAEPRRRANHGY